uniref:Uncharacterized protein n=1 Tax=Daphnia magna TaxID=35525 RepID=A0A0P5ZUR7_9CRUS
MFLQHSSFAFVVTDMIKRAYVELRFWIPYRSGEIFQNNPALLWQRIKIKKKKSKMEQFQERNRGRDKESGMGRK